MSANDATETPAPSRLNRIESLLVKNGVVSRDALHAAKARQRGAKRPLVEVLIEQEAVDEDLLVDVLAAAVRMPVHRDGPLEPEPSVQELVTTDVAQRLGVLPLRVEDGVLMVATLDPFQVTAFDQLAEATGYRVQPIFARPSAVKAAMRVVRKGEEVLHDLLKNTVLGDDMIVHANDGRRANKGPMTLAAQGSDGPTIKLVNLVLTDAITRSASDVHIETEESVVRVRFRVDGDLIEMLNIPASTAPSVLARIKIVAGLDIIETRRPQDGRAKVECKGRVYELRVSTLPSYFGEKAVIRILDPSSASFSLDASGLEPTLLSSWRRMTKRPNGLLLLTGPTGSGKTSTLYASLLEIRDPKLNIVAVEDPVEYQFPGIVHVPVRSDIGVTFAAALRSILRQDPDVVLVGEIRDAETAEIAVQAAMTGHLVLSTLHTNDAFGAIPRLLDLGIDRGRLASCLTGVIAQRLARRVCGSCAAESEADAEVLRTIGWDGATPITAMRGAGCRSCRGTGERGRTAIAELLTVTPRLQSLLTSGASEAELRACIAEDGTVPLAAAGLAKVADGTCTPEAIQKIAAAAPEGAAAVVQPQAESSSPADDSCNSCARPLDPQWTACPWCGTARERPIGLSVLICDDDALSRRLVRVALESDFAVIREATCGEQALEQIADRAPDLLVIDMLMPGLSGIEVIRQLRRDLETTCLPIIMLTGSTDEHIEEESFEAGADDYLGKPVYPKKLQVRARALIQSRLRQAAW